MKRFIAIFIITLLLGVTSSRAHLKLNSLSLKEPETFTAGDSVEITWKMDHPHSFSHYIYFRVSGDDEWKCIDSVKGQSSGVDYSYTWKVPETAADEGQLLVFLPEFRNTPAPQEHYTTLFSSKFTIAVPEPTAAARPSVPAVPVHGIESNPTLSKNVTLNGRVVSTGQLSEMENEKVPHCIILRSIDK